jgi:glycosyltransferase involved in cell wall biosynthesis
MLKPGAPSPLVLLASNTDWSIANFRGGLVRRLQAEGYRVAAAAPDSGQRLRLPCELIPITVERRAFSPLADLGLVLRLAALYRERRPLAVLTFTPKLNVLGALAAGRSEARLVLNVSGLGSGFLGGGLQVRLMQTLYRRAARRAERVFFQNADDLAYFVQRRLVDPRKTVLVPGSGVDLERFRPEPRAPGRGGKGFVFLLIGRLLKDKGIREYVEAARRIGRRRHPQVRFQILGQADPANPSAIPERELRAWRAEGLIEQLGWSEDVRPFIAAADCVVLPSYREGTPRTLLEAAAMARPLIAADVPGCRQVVEPGRTGYLCRVRDPEDLARMMRRMLDLPEGERSRLGAEGRRKMEREYDEALVIGRYLEVLRGFARP